MLLHDYATIVGVVCGCVCLLISYEVCTKSAGLISLWCNVGLRRCVTPPTSHSQTPPTHKTDGVYVCVCAQASSVCVFLSRLQCLFWCFERFLL